MLIMSTFGERLREARKDKRLTQEQLATKTNGRILQSTISKLEKGTQQQSMEASVLATVLGVHLKWLRDGKGPKSIHANVEEVDLIPGAVPLISWVQAGDWQPAADPYPPGGGEQVMSPVPIKEGMYALVVRGDSMFNPSGSKSYRDGCRIFVDPNRRDPNNGDRIIAKVDGDDEVTFKVFVKDGSRVFLKPLNPQYPIITETFRVLGTVVASAEIE